MKIDLSDLALEMLSIVVAILLAFALNAWHENWTLEAKERTAMLAVRDELRQNQSELLAILPLHSRVAAAYAALETHARQSRQMTVGEFWSAFRRTASHGYNPFRSESTAWDLARSSDVLENVPLATRITIERVYAEQRLLAEIDSHVVEDLHFRPDTPAPNFYYAAIAMQIDTSDSGFSERRLRDAYGKALAAINATLH